MIQDKYCTKDNYALLNKLFLGNKTGHQQSTNGQHYRTAGEQLQWQQRNSDTEELKQKSHPKKDIILISQVLSSLSSLVTYKYVMDLSCICLVLYFKHLVEAVNVEGISRVTTL